MDGGREGGRGRGERVFVITRRAHAHVWAGNVAHSGDDQVEQEVEVEKKFLLTGCVCCAQCIYVYVYMCLCVYVYICICVYVYVYICICA